GVLPRYVAFAANDVIAKLPIVAHERADRVAPGIAFDLKRRFDAVESEASAGRDAQKRPRLDKGIGHVAGAVEATNLAARPIGGSLGRLGHWPGRRPRGRSPWARLNRELGGKYRAGDSEHREQASTCEHGPTHCNPPR